MSFVNEPVLNIIVVGFHHKKGCQVEHCYPEFYPDRPTELPAQWRHLPALALPDGSHNFLSDTIYFHLPGLTEPAHTVYAVSCFRQIPIEEVLQKTEDMTRSSVQKSVCIVCRVPLFGRLAVKMELVVRAWFLQGDFAQTRLLEDAFNHLNNCPIHMDQIFEGLSAQRLVEVWRHKVLLLFKLLLLRRKVLMYGSPVGGLSATLLTLVSLLPRCLEEGLTQAANITLSRPLSPMQTMPQTMESNEIQDTVDSAQIAEEQYINGGSIITQSEELSPKEAENVVEEKDKLSFEEEKDKLSCEEALDWAVDSQELNGREKCNSVGEKYRHKTLELQSPNMARDMSVDGLYNLIGHIEPADCGFPLRLFEDGYLCLPYLSLQYLDLLSDPAVEGFVVGASNVLFKQKRQLFDVLVEVNELRIETRDLNLRRQLALGTEELRFADHVVRHAPTQGEFWVRDQFANYLVCLLRTSLLPDGSRELEPYNAAFMSAFKSTPAYLRWLVATDGGRIEPFNSIAPLHPFSGQLSVADMKLKLAHTMSTTEGGRKVTAAVASTGRAMATTSKAVGGALSQAKGALSGWWSALTTPAPDSSERQASDAEGQGSDTERQASDTERQASDTEKQASDTERQASDAEDAVLRIDNRQQPSTDPPDKALEDTREHISKIEVV